MNTQITPKTHLPGDKRPDDAHSRQSSGKSFKRILQNPWLKFGIRLGCTLLLLTLLLKSVSWQAMLQKIPELDDGELLLGGTIGLFGILVSSYQWQILLDAEHLKIDLRRLINLYLVGVAFNHFLPTGMGGDVIKSYTVGREGQNHTGSASAVILCRVTGFLGMLIVSLPALLIWHQEFPLWLILIFVGTCLAICVALVLALWSVTLLPQKLPARWREHRIFTSFFKVGNALWKSFKNPRTIWNATLVGALFHISAIMNYYAFGIVAHIPVPGTFYCVAIPLISVISFLPISINGYGLREMAIVSIFSIMHVPESSTLLMAILMDMQGISFGIMGGCIYLPGSQKKAGLVEAA